MVKEDDRSSCSNQDILFLGTGWEGGGRREGGRERGREGR